MCLVIQDRPEAPFPGALQDFAPHEDDREARKARLHDFRFLQEFRRGVPDRVLFRVEVPERRHEGVRLFLPVLNPAAPRYHVQLHVDQSPVEHVELLDRQEVVVIDPQNVIRFRLPLVRYDCIGHFLPNSPRLCRVPHHGLHQEIALKEEVEAPQH